MQRLGWVVARIPPPSAFRPLFDEDGAPTDQTREFFNFISKLSIEGDGDPNGVTNPTFIGQIYSDIANEDSYISTNLTNTGWKAIT